jgi:DNA-binding NtrC family response regulator
VNTSPIHSQTSERILLVDDIAENLSVLSASLEPGGYELLVATSGVEALALAAKAVPDLILLDILMPDLDGLETCRRLKEDPRTRDIPVIFLTARNEVEVVVAGFRSGGVDYVVKPFQAEEVLSRAATHLRLSRLTRELLEKNRALERRSAELLEETRRRHTVETALQQADDRLAAFSDLEADRSNLAGLMGDSPQIRRILEDVQRLHAFAQTSVLLTGESGTGKELIARAIHFRSQRARAPFVPVNCVAIPSELAESMLFGHVKGAFTGATSDRKGCFELAHRGTLFLDEIGDMPTSLQVKLLRVLEDGWVTPVGATSPRQVDVRVVAATNADLQARITAGSFREDLYFRLARYAIVTPPLRERLEDVLLLARHFLRLFAAELGLREARLSAEAETALLAYDYPGNVRELRNVIERGLIQCGGQLIEPHHLQLIPPSKPSIGHATSAAVAKGPRVEAAAGLPLNLAEAEELLIQRALQAAGGNIADAARMLGVHRTRIYRRLAQDGVT